MIYPSVRRSMEPWYVQLQLLQEFSDDEKEDLLEILNDPTKVTDPNDFFASLEKTVGRLKKRLPPKGRTFMAVSFFTAFFVQFILQSSVQAMCTGSNGIGQHNCTHTAIRSLLACNPGQQVPPAYELGEARSLGQ